MSDEVETSSAYRAGPRSRAIAAFVLAAYAIARVATDAVFQPDLSLWGVIGFEVSLVLVALIAFRKSVRWNHRWDRRDVQWGVVAVVVGVLAAGVVLGLDLAIPFALEAIETAVYLILIAPLGEELLFRFALWESLAAWLGDRRDRLINFITATLFSLHHLSVIAILPESYRTFVWMQTAFAFGFGIALGIRRRESQSVVPTVLVHAALNVGFYLVARFAAR